MKGVLKYTTAGWYVWYQVMVDEITSSYESIPIHPHLEKYYFLDRDAADSEVEFVIENFWETGLEKLYRVAKLTKPEYTGNPTPLSHALQYPYIEGTMNLCNDKIWDDIYHDYSAEQYPAFGGPFTNSISFIDWLKQNYKAPEKL